MVFSSIVLYSWNGHDISDVVEPSIVSVFTWAHNKELINQENNVKDYGNQ